MKSLRLIALIALAFAIGSSSSVGQAQGNAAGLYRIVDRVEVNYGGTWYKGVILAVRDGQYQVKRDDYMSDDRWVTASDIRRVSPEARKAPVPTSTLPRAVPNGAYVCTTIVAGFYSSTSSGSTIGTFRVVEPGAYTGLTKSGTGARSSFKYDPRSGSIQWDGGGLKGFFGKITESRFDLDQKHVPYIDITYRVRDGGNLFTLSCRREG